MTNSANVSVCIPTRNQSGYVLDTLESVLRQTVLPCEIVVSDDASTDATKEVVAKFGALQGSKLKGGVRYVRNDQALGLGGNSDRAVRLGSGDYCVKLDSDDMLEPRFVEVLKAQLEANPKAGWAHANVLNITSDGKPLGLAHTRKKTGFYSPEQLLPAYLRHNDTCHCVMLRKTAYLSVGGYRPEMRAHEDWLLWLEMIINGWGYVFDDQRLARMRKYDYSREMMTLRRQGIISCSWLMVDLVSKRLKGRGALPSGIAPVEALRRLRFSVARICINAAMHEPDRETRHDLFKAACAFSGSQRHRVLSALGRRLPLAVLELMARTAGAPRGLARNLVQRLRGIVRT